MFILDFQNDLKKFKWCSYNTLNCLKLIRKKKVMRFESRKGPKKIKKEKKTFCNLKNLLLLLFLG
jgi:hypothetical protein